MSASTAYLQLIVLNPVHDNLKIINISIVIAFTTKEIKAYKMMPSKLQSVHLLIFKFFIM